MLAALGGGRTVWCAGPDPHIAVILAARMPGVPNLGDVRAIDWARVEPVEVLTAGFPCQGISAAGRRAGIGRGPRPQRASAPVRPATRARRERSPMSDSPLAAAASRPHPTRSQP
ncbi:hypothetical protein KUTG_02313 [Kutzneria sp. 744]|nr:DNA cytosine methyltransferase [Kutzneria sp. 744]EWM12009.1 hypothetical protein KUTG_02313 [Kutzneria sp. 744]